MNKLLAFVFTTLMFNYTYGESLDNYVRNGLKYPVVTGVLLCIFIGIGLFLILLERRIRKAESK